MKYFFCCLFLCAKLLAANGQVYNASSIPESLKKNASVIVHLDNTNVDIEDIDKATVTVHKIFTVLNDEAKDELMFNEYSNKYYSLDDAEIKVFDEKGKQTAKYKKKEMSTQSVGEGLVEEGFVTYYKVPVSSYPVTVEFDYTKKLKSTLYVPDFRYVHAKEAVVEANYTARLPESLNLRYKAKLSSLNPQMTDDGKYKTFTWSVKNIAAAEDAEGSVSERDKFPYVNIVTDKFDYFGNAGDLSSWKNFGKWIGGLYQGLDELPADRQQFFQQLVKDAPNDVEKIRLVYHYLQENFRYVSIQLGIGGLKPFSATFTDQKKYGDCKALSNYMKAALKSVGIKSFVAIINAKYNEEPVDPDFPANDFNHVIICVPQAKDSIWLECTSSTSEFGKLGTFTENRNALLVTEDGGVLVPTPKSKSSDNTLTTHTSIDMDKDLSGLAKITIDANGEYDDVFTQLLKEKKDDQKEFMVLYMGYKEPDDMELTAKDGSDNHETELKMAIRKVPDFSSGSKYFICPRINKIFAENLPTADNRKLDFYFNFPFENRDTTVIKLPKGFQSETLPKETTLTTNYSYYQSKSWYNEKENAIYTATTLILQKHKIPAADYASLKNFFDDVVKDDSQRVVVKKTE